ncbi:angiopoietin-related protein 6-like [Biomphalaria glabrata]|uniref:Angiopoietin-related protein 6-like n=1 Tax=Biomphalaria glabrata TaxID=6526 RepID=A0A9W2ZY89_BIOGL|nr:angiopoietin-related protein 6-like [Biomphalaria glabrata]XP_055880026.1 angiopoietin-related protein 6-like [Biomphalaria glabrata]XP_055880027.1 angiopoietin-related protein 6-like [Biomphalaria glabrata]
MSVGKTCVAFLLCCAVFIEASPYSTDYTEALNANDKTQHKDCRSIMKAGYNVSGVYRLSLNGTNYNLPCEFKDGNAFTVILRRWSNSISFIQSWGAYESGFGHPQDNYWAGLAAIYVLTTQGNNNLQINMQDWSGNNQNAVYSQFYLENRNTRYRLHVGPYRGSLPDELSYNNNMPFSTIDAPDPYGCASNMKAGWWYNYCSYTLPTGIYYPNGWYTPSGSMYDGMFWKDWYGYNYSLKFMSMTLSN